MTDPQTIIDDNQRAYTEVTGRLIQQRDEALKEVEFLRAQLEESRSLHDAGCKEAYRICGVEDDGEYRWKWVLLELSGLVKDRAELVRMLERVKDELSERIKDWKWNNDEREIDAWCDLCKTPCVDGKWKHKPACLIAEAAALIERMRNQ